MCAVGIALLGLAVHVIAASPVAAIQPQEMSFTIHERLIIGDDEDAPSEYLLTYPDLVRTDSPGNIYVKDEKRVDVRVFDASGQYLTTIGKRGEGPGEMREIIGMHVDADNRLIISDRMNRRFTVFTDLGRSFTTKPFTVVRMITPDPILSLDGAYLIQYVQLYANPEGGPSLKDHRFLHLYSADLNRIETFGLLEDVFDMSRPFLNAESGLHGAIQVATNGKDTIVVAPQVYDGSIYRFTRPDGLWVIEKLKGLTVAQPSYIPVSLSDFESNDEVRRMAKLISGSAGMNIARIFSHSRGIGILSTGQIVHFPLRTPLKEDFEPLVELYGKDGILQGFGQLQFDDPKLNNSTEVMESIDVKWIDSEDRIYLARRNPDGFFVLSVAELKITPL